MRLDGQEERRILHLESARSVAGVLPLRLSLTRYSRKITVRSLPEAPDGPDFKRIKVFSDVEDVIPVCVDPITCRCLGPNSDSSVTVGDTPHQMVTTVHANGCSGCHTQQERPVVRLVPIYIHFPNTRNFFVSNFSKFVSCGICNHVSLPHEVLGLCIGQGIVA